MKIRSLNLSNVRRFAGETATLNSIGDGITVFSAPNETGKSTFFDALHALFFQPYSSQNREIKSLQPHSGGAVVVSAEIETDDGRYALEKTWLSKKSAKVTDCGTGRLLAQDDEAEAWIDQLIRGGLGGPAGLLWVRQGTTSLEPAGSTTAEKRERETGLAARRDLMSTLAGEIDLMTGGRRMDHVLAACKTKLAELATATGKPKVGGQWKRADDEVEALQELRSDLAAKVTELSGALQDRRNAEAERLRLDDPEERKTRDSALHIARDSLKAAETHVELIEAAEREMKIAGLEQQAAESALAELVGLARALKEAEAAVSLAEKDRKTALEARNQKAETKSKAAEDVQLVVDQIKSLREAFTKAQKAAVARLAADRLSEVQSQLKKAEQHAELLAQAKAKVAGNQIDDEALARISGSAQRVTEAKARRDALAVSVTPQYTDGKQISLDGETLPDGQATTIMGNTRLDLPGIGALDIDTGGRESADAAQIACQKAERELEEQLEKAGMTNIADARAAHTERQKAQADVSRTTEFLESLAPDGIDQLRETVAVLAQSAATAQPSEVGDPDVLAGEIADAESKETVARSTLQDAQKELGETENLIASIETKLQLASETAKEARTALGTEAEQSERMAKATDGVRQTGEILSKAKQARDELVNTAPDMENLRAEFARAEGAVKSTAERLRMLSDQVHQLDGLIRARAEDGIEERLSEVEGQLDAAELRAKRYEREVTALGRLARALESARHAARDAYFEPVKAELLPLLSLLHSDADIRLDDTSLLPVALTRQGQEEEIDILSGGTSEQIAILTRLAFARLFARNGQNVPVILDDALIHSDDDRIERMFTALHRIAGDQQILVFTCRQRAFSHLGGAQAHFSITKD